MKLIGVVCFALMSFTLNAHAESVITGQLTKSEDHFQVFDDVNLVISNLVIDGNSCGKAITEGQLEAAVGATVELTGDIVPNSVGIGCGITHESFEVMTFPDGERVHILAPAQR